MSIEPGHIAIVHLTGRLVDGPESGEVFETTDVDVALETGVYHDHRDFKPLEFRVGESSVLPGIDEAVRGMSPGESTMIVLDPEDAYGTVDEDAIITVPRDELEARSHATAEPGELVESGLGDVGWITRVSDNQVTINFNHELAGQRVSFDIKVLESHAGITEQEIESE
ncbi:FKBP-type peptidyl-prolyl cis-trans isomerase [Halobellus captivus]|uniref:FKBP-type peptidyl-prolyl cis-trans isomerase n=1 Tax=Halobellus captivus TaxID=2592614 RepID=UPI0011A0587B|nr:FKBP-type peptidyl-prolyl cis-trans isomerase [Halobellus captivus]